MKNFGRAFITVGAAALKSVSVYANDTVGSDSRIFVNGEEIYDASAITYDGIYNGSRALCGRKTRMQDILGRADKTATIKDASKTVEFTEGVSTMIVDNRIKDIPVPMIIEDGNAYVPIRALSDGLDIDVTWTR